MIILNKTQKEVFAFSEKRLKKINGEYLDVSRVIKKRFSKVSTENLPHYINYYNCKKVIEGKDIEIYSYLHEKKFLIKSKLIREIGIINIIGWLFAINNHFYSGIKENAKSVVYKNITSKDLHPVTISDKKSLIKNSFITSSKKTKKHRKSIATCSLRPIYKNISLGIEPIEAMGFGISTDRNLSQQKAISESIERMLSGLTQIRVESNNNLHKNITNLYLGSTGKEVFLNKDTNLYECYSIFSNKKYSLPGNILYYPYLENNLRNGNSNGVGCHISKEKAIENGLFELIERDAFMLFWLTKSHGKKIVPPNKVKDRIKEQTYGKYETHLFLLNFDHPLPVVLTVIKREKKIVCSMGVGYSLDEAIKKSLNESGQFAVDHLDYSTETKDDDLIVEKHIKHYLKEENYMNVKWFFEIPGISYDSIAKTKWINSYKDLLIYYQTKGEDLIIHEYNHAILEIMNRKCVRVLSENLIPIRFGGMKKDGIYNHKRVMKASKMGSSKGINKKIHPFG